MKEKAPSDIKITYLCDFFDLQPTLFLRLIQIECTLKHLKDMAAHKPIFTKNEVKPENHAFDPITASDAQKLLDGFSELRESKHLNVSESAFFFDSAALNILLSENRNGRRDDLGYNIGYDFDGITVYFGLDADDKIILLIQRDVCKNDWNVVETYAKVPQTRAVYWPHSNRHDIIEYAMVPVSVNGTCEIQWIDINSETYKKLRQNFQARFENGNDILTWDLPPNVYPKNIAEYPIPGKKFRYQTRWQQETLITGYFLGKVALRRELWYEQGNGVGIKLFLGYGPNVLGSSLFPNMHLVAVGTETAEIKVSNFEGDEKLWGTQPRPTLQRFKARMEIPTDGGTGPVLGGAVPMGTASSSCVTPVKDKI